MILLILTNIILNIYIICVVIIKLVDIQFGSIGIPRLTGAVVSIISYA